MVRGLWIVVVVGLVFFAGGVVVAQRSEPVIRQPIQFNHAGHKAKGVQCAFCHESVEGQALAGIPPVGTCMICHVVPQTKSPEEEKIRQVAGRGQEIPWKRLYGVPDHVFFSHQRHVTLGKVNCKTCHGAIGEAMTPPRSPAVNQTMDWCIDCHERREASVDCNACHR